MTNAASRLSVARYRATQEALGLQQLTVWLPADMVGHWQAEAARLVAEHITVMEDDPKAARVIAARNLPAVRRIAIDQEQLGGMLEKIGEGTEERAIADAKAQSYLDAVEEYKRAYDRWADYSATNGHVYEVAEKFKAQAYVRSLWMVYHHKAAVNYMAAVLAEKEQADD